MQRVLILGGRSSQEAGLVSGCRHYVQEHGLPWQVQAHRTLADIDPTKVDAAIGFAHHSDMQRLAALAQIRMVAVGPSRAVAHQAQVTFDDAAIGRMAADFASQHGYAALALVGGRALRSRRFDPAAERARELGLPVCHYDHRAVDFDDPAEKEPHLQEWLHRQPQPLLAWSYQDRSAAWLLQVCLQAGLAVPQAVSVLGVDDDVWLCESRQPTLSSIHIPWRLVGYRCALQAHRLLSGATPEPDSIRPLRVTERQSTRRDQRDDPLLTAAFTYLEEHRSQAPALGTVAQHLGVSRQTLFRHCHRVLGVSLAAGWLERRLLGAADALERDRHAAKSIATIAKRAGFTNPGSFRHAFRRRFGLSPSLYRSLAHTRARSDL